MQKNNGGSEKYAEFLKTYSKFHKYSINNSIMILMQRPDASNVASFQTWKKLGRQITKGQKGIKVLVPIPYKYEKEVETNQLDGKAKAFAIIIIVLRKNYLSI